MCVRDVTVFLPAHYKSFTSIGAGIDIAGDFPTARIRR
jgi:hypothetical protein